jgi:DNA-directed RNA polymerase specialized sigma24 family protein
MPSPAESLRAAARRYEREKAKLDRQVAKNTAERDKAVKKAHAAGLTMREIAKLAGVSYQRVGQIIKGS